MISKPPKADDPAQSARFLALAKELEAEGSTEDLEKAVKALAPQKRRAATKAGKKK